MAESRAETPRRRDVAAPWPKVRLGEICESISDGDHLPPPKSNEGIPFITISDIGKEGELDFSNSYHVPRSYYDKIDEKRKPRQGDILYTVVGSFGKAVLIGSEREFCFQRHIAILRPNFRKINSHYLYSQMRSQAFFAQADAFAIGVAQRTISLSALRRMIVSLPPLAIQRAIEERLSAYDNLIENNRRRIAILERMAEQIYKEWFVRKRGVGKVTFTSVSLFDVANISYGYPFRSDRFCGDETLNPVVRIRDIQDNSTATFTSEQCDDKYLIEKNAILVGMDGLFHMCLWNGQKAYLNQRVVKIVSKSASLCNYLLFLLIAPHIEYFEKTITGTTVAHLGDKHLRKIKIEIPDDKSLDRINQPFERLMELKWNLQRQNALLAKERDLLLPRLMSGSMEVKHV